MISKEMFCKALNMIKEQEVTDEDFGRALQKVGNGHFVFGTENKYRQALLMVLKEAVNDQYDYIGFRPDVVNIKSRQNVWWKCGTCGYEWRSLVKTRVKGAKCPVCAARAVLPGYNDLATTDLALLPEWDYEKNGEVVPENTSRHSMKSVWWKCEFGHSWKDLISHRTIDHAGCCYCQKEFKTVLPQLLIMLYCSQRGLELELSDESRLGVLIDAYIPELKLAINTVEARTKRGDDTWSVTKHLCEKRGIISSQVSVNNSLDLICANVKRAFQAGNVFIVSDNTKDIETAWEKFILLKRKRGDGK